MDDNKLWKEDTQKQIENRYMCLQVSDNTYVNKI